MTAGPTDEELMALADGELEPARAAEIRALFAHDPDLAARFADFAETRALLDETPAPAVSPALAAAVLRAAAGAASDARPVLTAIPGGRFDGTPAPVAVPVRAPRPALRLAAMAAAVALAAGGVLGYALRPAIDGGASAVSTADLSPDLLAALDGAPSGATRVVDLGGGRRGTIGLVSSYAIAGPGLCREYTLADAGAANPREFAVACRAPGESWRRRLVVAAGDDRGFATASGPQEVIDPFLEAIGASARLSPDAERAALGALR